MHNVLAIATHLRESGQTDSSSALILALLGDKPDYADAHLALAETLLMNGDYAAGWKSYEWRYRTEAAKSGQKPPVSSPVWNGMKMATGRLLVHAAEGCGDAIMFSRFLPMMRERVAHLVLAIAEPRVGLFEGFPGVDMIVSNFADVPPHAAHISLSSAPYVLDVGANIPPPLPLSVAWGLADHGSELIVGLAWSGNATYADNARRSIPLRELRLLARIPDVKLVCLQTHVTDEDKPFLAEFGMLLREGDDFTATAREMSKLDAVVTVDTSTAHIAGAMGIPTLVMLHHKHAHMWAWGTGDRSLWYPDHKLVRQDTPGDWAPVVDAVETWIRERAAERAVTRCGKYEHE